MNMIIEIIIGFVLASIAVLIIRKIYPQKDHAFWRMGLLIAALIYVGFAVLGANWEHLPMELGGVLIYGLFAFLSKKYTLYYLAIGWLLHICWDVFLHRGTTTPYVPDWYPGACIGFDVVIAGYILFLIYQKNRLLVKSKSI